MAVKTHVSFGYAAKMIIMAILCLVFGLWGVYDYLYTIPNRHLRYDLFRSTELTRDALTAKPSDQGFMEKQEAAKAYIQEALPRFSERFKQQLKLSEDMTTEELEAAKAKIESEQTPEIVGFAALSTYYAAVSQPRVGGELTPAQKNTFQIAEMMFNKLSADGTPSPPSKFDRPIQWAFILCIPFTPYFLWLFLKANRRVYRLDDDGTLHLPEGRQWAESEVVDIDMSRWMSKSIATLIHKDGERIALDDYLYKNMHLIVGHFAHKFAPDEWQEDAKMVRRGESEAEAAEEAESVVGEEEPVESDRV